MNPMQDEEYLSHVFVVEEPIIPHVGGAVRVDWASKVGIKFPGYERYKRRISEKAPIYFLNADIDVEWWERPLITFRNGDLSGNGKKVLPWADPFRRQTGQPWPIVILRKMIHYDAMTMIAERGGGSKFVREIADYPAFAVAKTDLEGAAGAFKETASQMGGWWKIVGKIWNDEDA